MPDDQIVEQTPEQVQQEQQAAEAAFAIAADDTPAKAAAPDAAELKAGDADETKADPNKDDKVDPNKEEADPWLGVNPIVRAKLEGIDKLSNDMRQFTTEMKTAAGRMQSEMAAAKLAASKVDNAPTQEQIAAAAATPEKWDKLKELFKEWSDEFSATDAIDERITGRLAAERAETLKAIPKVDVEEITKGVRELARIDMKHPSWEEDIYVPKEQGGGFTPAFAAWRNIQPPEIQALGGSNLARDAIKMLDLYYDHQKKVAEQEKKQQRLEAAIPAKGTPGQRQQTQSEQDAAEKAFESA